MPGRRPLPGPSGALRDLRCAARLLVRAPRFTATLVVVLGLGVGAGASLLVLVEAGVRHPAPVHSPAGLPLPVPDAGAVSATAGRRPVEAGGGVQGGAPLTGRSARQSIGEIQRRSLVALLWTLGGAAMLTLGIACSNLALLLLSRASARRRDTALRLVLGAPGGRLVRQLLSEGLVLVALGTAVGLPLAGAGVLLLRESWPEGLAPWLRGPVGGWGLALAVGLPALATLAFSAAPAVGVRRQGLHTLVAGGARATGGREEGHRRDHLAVAAVAVSFALLTGAGVLLRGFGALPGDAGPGPGAREAVTLQLHSPASLAPRQRALHYAALLERLRGLPGVEAESLSSPGAWVGLGSTDLVHALTGNPTRPGLLRPARHHAVSPGYFRALGVPVLRGREFVAGDREGAAAVAIVSETFAHRFFPGVDPLGKHVQLGRMSLRGTWYTIVGVVADVRPRGLGSQAEPAPALYLSALQAPPPTAGLTFRADDPGRALPLVRRAILTLQPRPEIGAAESLGAHLARFRGPLRWMGALFGALALFATLLAAFGLYGVVAYNVRRRTREIGIRMAVGARAPDVVRRVVREGARLTAVGVGVGAAAALCLARLLQFLFLGVRIADPLPYLAVTLLLGSVALLASYLPARAAARVDPVVALRAE